MKVYIEPVVRIYRITCAILAVSEESVDFTFGANVDDEWTDDKPIYLE